MLVATHPEAQRLFGVSIEQMAQRILQPPPDLKLSDWAEQHRILASQASEKGPYRLSRVPYLREILEEFSNPEVREMVILKSARLGVTDGVINNGVGYCIDQDPGQHPRRLADEGGRAGVVEGDAPRALRAHDVPARQGRRCRATEQRQHDPAQAVRRRVPHGDRIQQSARAAPPQRALRLRGRVRCARREGLLAGG
jgi:hypothetical protein